MLEEAFLPFFFSFLRRRGKEGSKERRKKRKGRLTHTVKGSAGINGSNRRIEGSLKENRIFSLPPPFQNNFKSVMTAMVGLLVTSSITIS